MDAVLISIKPEWVSMIVHKLKTLEIRKSMPKTKLPFKVYIYCSYGDMRTNYMLGKRGKVVAEFICKQIDEFDRFQAMEYYPSFELGKSCLSVFEINKYIGDKKGFAWHIDDLIVYEKPLPLKAFRHCQFKGSIYEGCCDNCHNAHHSYPGWVETREDLYDCQIESTCCNYLKKPPQSWCYVHELEVAHDN